MTKLIDLLPTFRDTTAKLRSFACNSPITFLLVLPLFVQTGFAQNVVKQVVRFENTAPNLLRTDGFRPYEAGFQFENGIYICDNGSDTKVTRGAAQTVTLNQTQPDPIVAELWSKAENVSGIPSGGDYGIYVDITYTDGTSLWGQTAAFDAGTHDWQKKTLTILPFKPVRSLVIYALFRNKSGKAAFRDMKLSVPILPDGTSLFDGVLVVPKGKAALQIRDVAANSDYFELEGNPIGVNSTVKTEGRVLQVTLDNSDDKDRCVTLVYTMPVIATVWCEHPRSDISIEPNLEYMHACTMPDIGSNGRLSLYPFAAVLAPGVIQPGNEPSRLAAYGVGIDMKTPGFFRTGYNSGTSELFVAVDIALTKESPTATFNFVLFAFEPNHKFRGALDVYYKLFPDYFESRTPEQGVWMPFTAISTVQNHEDFGFKFKEGDNEVTWDDAHDILTFRYTEPGTWWMPMPPGIPHTYDTALAHAKKLAEEGNARALALFKSGMHDAAGNLVGQIRDEPWNKGIVWSINDMPEIEGGSFALKWSPKIYADYYERKERGILDGEYVDSAEGWVTAPLDYRRDNFAAARTPLVFSQEQCRPAIFKGLMFFEYDRKIADDMHKNAKLMFANSTPAQLCWLAPFFDAMGTETNWNYGGQWRPMADSSMLYRRVLCGPKPYCFLMNTDFTQWTYDMSERFMRRCLAYGMFPGFFSADASTKTYFSQPDLYNRDRPLFKKYVPICKHVADSGWQPITLATSSDAKVYVERFGNGETTCFTVFNDSQDTKTTTLRFETEYTSFKDLVSGNIKKIENGELHVTLLPEDVAVLEPQE